MIWSQCERWARKHRKSTQVKVRVEGDGGRWKDECIVLYCVYVLLSVLCIQHRWFGKCFRTKTHFIRYILKVLQKTSEVFLSFLFFLFSWIWWPVLLFGLPLQLICQMNNHYFNRSYSKALQLQKTWYDIQHLLHLYNVIQQCIESSDLNL